MDSDISPAHTQFINSDGWCNAAPIICQAAFGRFMSYRCPKCNGMIYDRTNYVCALCGAELPAGFLFLPPEMAALGEAAGGTGIPVALLAQALLELRKARGNAEETRLAAIRYFRNGIAGGFQVGPLLNWLMSWPEVRWSVFSQAGYSAKEGKEFVEMLKKLPAQELGLNDTTTAA
jgi:hypothetical protein